MSDTTYYAKAVRFCRQYSADNLSARYSALPAAVEALRLLKIEPWKYIPSEKQILLPPHSEVVGSPTTLDNFDAYSICADHSGELHRAYAGMAAYRITLPDSFAGLALKSLAVRVSCDPYNVAGARLSLVTSASTAPLPSSCWTCATVGTVHLSGVAPRTVNLAGTIAYGATATATFAVAESNAIPSLGKYLWVYLSLENYEFARNGWLEGAAALDPQFTLVTTEAAAGYVDGSAIGGGYVAPSAILNIGQRSNMPKAMLLSAPSVSMSTRYRWRELLSFYTSLSYSETSTDPTAENSIPALYASLGLALANHAVVAPGAAIAAPAGDVLTPIDFYGSTGWQVWQYGLSANFRRYWNVSVSMQQLHLTLSLYMMQMAFDPSFEPRSLTLSHPTGAATLSLGGMRVRVSAWWCSSQMVTLFGSLALCSSPGFWTGGSSAAAGTISDNVAAPNTYTETASAVLLGSVVLTDSIVADQEFKIVFPKTTFGRYGTLILVPWIDGVDNGLALGEQKGLGTLSRIGNTYADGEGWEPNVTLS